MVYYCIMKKIAVLIGMYLLLSGFQPLVETPKSTFGEVYCAICHRTLVKADHNGCRKVTPEFSDNMAYAACGNPTKNPILVWCPFDGGILHLKEE